MKQLGHFFLFTCCLLVACGDMQREGEVTTTTSHGYPPSAGFDLDNSDATAIAIADKVMDAMGGYKNWKATRYIHWNFFGVRTLLWDKWTGNVRINSKRDSAIILVNIHTLEGKAMKKGEVIEHTDSLKLLLQKGKEIWINDSYWLVMPFKLKDSGVTLTYQGTDTTAKGAEADVLRLTFKEVGVTPQNAYDVFVEKSTNLVKQWAFYATADEDTPRFTTPWEDYQQYGQILLSGNRGRRQLTEIKVLDPDGYGSIRETFDANFFN